MDSSVKNMIRTVGMVLAIAICASASAHAKTYKFVMPVPKGLSIGSIGQMTKNAGKAINQKTGMDIVVEEYEYTYLGSPMEVLLDKLNKDQIDFLMVFPMEYLMYKMNHPKDKSIPLFTITMFGKPFYQVCFYTRKSDNITKPDALKGKVWGGVRMRYAEYLLHQHNIKTPMGQFFSKQKFLREENIAVMLDAVIKGDVDVITMPTYQVNMVANTDKKYQAVSAVGCQDYEHNWIIVYRKGVPKSDAEALKKAFLVMHKDKDFAQFKFLLTAVKGKFVDVNIKDLQTTAKIAKLMQKYKWLKTEAAYIKKHEKEAQ